MDEDSPIDYELKPAIDAAASVAHSDPEVARAAFLKAISPLYAGDNLSTSSRATHDNRIWVPEAFGEVFDRHWPSVYRYCRSRVGADGEDLAAETFPLAFDLRAAYESERDDARPWLLGIATNLIRNHLRRCDRGKLAMMRLCEFEEPKGGADDIAIGREEAAQLGPVLAQALEGIRALNATLYF